MLIVFVVFLINLLTSILSLFIISFKFLLFKRRNEFVPFSYKLMTLLSSILLPKLILLFWILKLSLSFILVLSILLLMKLILLIFDFESSLFELLYEITSLSLESIFAFDFDVLLSSLLLILLTLIFFTVSLIIFFIIFLLTPTELVKY